MAIGPGSVVAIRNISALLTAGNVGGQPPVFGDVETASPFTINWFNGLRSTGVLAVSLDEITDASSDTLNLLGQSVVVTGYGPSYIGVAVSAYHRVGLVPADYVLIKMNESGAWIEALASDVAAVDG